jgi:hypothetical protein
MLFITWNFCQISLPELILAVVGVKFMKHVKGDANYKCLGSSALEAGKPVNPQRKTNFNWRLHYYNITFIFVYKLDLCNGTSTLIDCDGVRLTSQNRDHHWPIVPPLGWMWVEGRGDDDVGWG